MHYLLRAAAMVLCLGPVAAHAADLAAAFGARPAAHGMAISPQATKVLYLAPAGTNGTAVIVVDVATGKTNIALGSNTNVMSPGRCFWKTETRLICELHGTVTSGVGLVEFTRIVAVDADGSNVKQLGQRSTSDDLRVNQSSGSIIDALADDPKHVLVQIRIVEKAEWAGSGGSNIQRPHNGISVQRVDIHTNAATIVESPSETVFNFATDSHGTVRLKTGGTLDPDGYRRSRVHYFVRAKNDRAWLPIGSGSLEDNAGLSFDGFDEGGESLYALQPKDGRAALYKVAADGTGKSELVFARPDVDIDGVLRIGKYDRPVAVAYTVEAEQYDYFDPALLKLSRALHKALPGQPAISILDESWDRSKKLVAATSSINPGTYYLYDDAKHDMSTLLPLRPELSAMTLAEAKPVKYPAADGTMIPAYLTLPPGTAPKRLRTIVMPHGGPSSRDTGGFDWLAQYFVQLGYAVLQPNYRGSTGYGEAWYKENGFKSWQTAIGDINDGARWLIAQGIADPAKLAIVGWSYGGYAALQSNVLAPDLFKAVVAVAPVTDLEGLRTKELHYTDYAQMDAFIGHGPHVAGGSPARNAAAFRAPVLIFSGDHDSNVDVSQARTMDSALASAGKVHELRIYPGLDHQLDDSDARTDLLRRSAAFLEAHLK